MKKKNGFTLIELMIVIVIIGILVSIALPSFIAAQDRAKIASVKTNMRTVQIMLETYAVDWGGLYPAVLITSAGASALTGEGAIPEAVSKKYYKSFNNPFTTKSGADAGFQINPTSNVQINPTTGIATAQNHLSGAVSYAAVNPVSGSTITKYFLYGGGKINSELISEKGKPFTLTNN